MPGVILYHYPSSFYSQLVRLALEEKQVSWTSRVVDMGATLENYAPWYIRLNPGGVVPTLDHNGTIVTESARIIRYIDDKLEGPPLAPDDAEGREEMERWLRLQEQVPVRELSYGSLDKKALGFLARFANQQRVKALDRLRLGNPDLDEVYAAKQKDIKALQVASADRALAEDLGRQLDEALDAVETALRDGRTWLAGSTYTLADVAWTVLLARLRMLGRRSLWENGRRPLIADYFERARARPTFEKADVWDRTKPRVMVPLVARALAARIRDLVSGLRPAKKQPGSAS